LKHAGELPQSEFGKDVYFSPGDTLPQVPNVVHGRRTYWE